MSCTVDISPQGEVIVTGENASLFNEAFLYYGNDVDALDVYSTSLTQGFQETGLAPTVQNVVRYLESDNIQQASEFSPQELQDIYNTNYKQFLQATTVDGEFALNYENLRTFFSPQEADELLSDPSLQNKVHRLWYKFQNQEEYLEDYEFVEPPVKILTDEKTALGTYRKENPDKVYNELGAIATQAETVSELNLKLSEAENPLFSEVDATEEIVQEYEGKQALPQYTENPTTQQLEKKVYDSTESQILHTYDPTQNTHSIQEDVVFLLSIDNDVISANTSPAQDILHRIEQATIELGLDTVGLAETQQSIEELKEYLSALSQFLYNPVESVSSYAQAHNDFFSIQETQDRPVVLSIQGNDLMVIQSQKSEYELYRDYGVIRIQGDVFKKVSKETENLFEDFYQRVLQDPSIVPQRVLYPYAFETETEISTQKLRNPRYKTQIKRSLEKYVNSLLPSLQTTESTPEVLQEFAVQKLVNKSQQRVLQKSDYYNTMYSRDNSKFLDSFLPKINKYILKQKERGNEIPVSWTQRGLELPYDGTYSAVQLLYSLPQSLREDTIKYAQITGNMPSVLKIANTQYLNDIESDVDFNRNYYANFPDQLPNYTNAYQTLDDNTIQTRSTENFIKIRNQVYEKVTENIFTKIPNQNSLAWDRPQQKPTKQPQSEQQQTTTTTVKVFSTNQTTQELDQC